MELNELLTKQYERVWSGTDKTLEGLSDEGLAWRPSPECNSIGWLAWHVGRVEDRWTSLLLGNETRGSGYTTYVDDQWDAGVGRGDGDAQRSWQRRRDAAVRSRHLPHAELELLQGYYEAVRADTRAMLATLRPGMLGEGPRFALREADGGRRRARADPYRAEPARRPDGVRQGPLSRDTKGRAARSSPARAPSREGRREDGKREEARAAGPSADRAPVSKKSFVFAPRG